LVRLSVAVTLAGSNVKFDRNREPDDVTITDFVVVADAIADCLADVELVSVAVKFTGANAEPDANRQSEPDWFGSDNFFPDAITDGLPST
jgi:hypothetical protein